jgi:LPXTG-motif cell wall-anchored protein
MKIFKLSLSVLLFSFVISTPVQAAKKFSNTYIEFSIPDSWSCKEEGGQHVCQPINPEQRKEAIVVMAAKYKGPEDELKNYMSKLNEKREVKDVKGKVYTSKNQYTKWNSLLGTVWVDSQNEDSEVPGFITRYLATVQKGVGIVVTFSAHKSKFSQYSSDFYQMINSLRISNNIPAAPADKSSDLTRLGSGAIVGNLEKAKKEGAAPSQVQIQVSKESDLTTYIAILGAAIIVAAFLIIRKRRRRK